MARPRLAGKYIKQAKGDFAKAWRLQRKARGTTKRRRTPATKPRRRNTMARRKSTRRKKSRNINLRLLETGSALMILDQAGVIENLAAMTGFHATKTTTLKDGVQNVLDAVRNRDTQIGIAKTAGTFGLLKYAARTLGVHQIGSIGPLKLRV